MFLVARVFFSFGALSGLVRTASALCRLLICCSAPKMHISHSIAAAQLPPSRRDATTLEINTRSIDCTFGQMTKYPQQNPVFRPKWQNIAEEHVGNTQRAKHSSIWFDLIWLTWIIVANARLPWAGLCYILVRRPTSRLLPDCRCVSPDPPSVRRLLPPGTRRLLRHPTKHSSTIMRDTIRGRLPVWRPAASLQAVQRDPKSGNVTRVALSTVYDGSACL